MCEKLSQTEIARRAGVSPSTVHYILQGDREPSKEMCVKLAIATGVLPGAWAFPETFYNPYIPIESAPLGARAWKYPIRDCEEWARQRCEWLAQHAAIDGDANHELRDSWCGGYLKNKKPPAGKGGENLPGAGP